ncbi:hypothetical protein E4U11_005667, partial [Claviceps purpurea]
MQSLGLDAVATTANPVAGVGRRIRDDYDDDGPDGAPCNGSLRSKISAMSGTVDSGIA